MITNKKELRFYIQEDRVRNMGNASWFSCLLEWFYGTDNIKVYRYLKALRKYEYAINVQQRSLLGKIVWVYRKWIWHKLGEKYGLVIPPNKVGYGFKISHIGGGHYY